MNATKHSMPQFSIQGGKGIFWSEPRKYCPNLLGQHFCNRSVRKNFKKKKNMKRGFPSYLWSATLLTYCLSACSEPSKHTATIKLDIPHWVPLYILPNTTQKHNIPTRCSNNSSNVSAGWLQTVVGGRVRFTCSSFWLKYSNSTSWSAI